MKIQQYYKIYFFRIVTIPFIVILIIAMIWVGRANEEEIKAELRLSAENVRNKLSEEISDYSTRFSYFMNSNDKEVLDNITMYSRGDMLQRYQYDKELSHWYNLNIIQISPFTTIDFYLNNDTKYSFENNSILDRQYIENSSWYKASIANPDRICIDIIRTEDALSSHKNIKEEELIIASMSMEGFAKDTDVEMGVLTAKSKALEMINNPKDWTYNHQMYLVSEDGRLLCSTDNKTNEQFTGEIDEHITIIDNNNIDYYGAIEPRTKWKVIAVVDKMEYRKGYVDAIYMISIGMLMLFCILYFATKRVFMKVTMPINSLSLAMNTAGEIGKFEKVKVEGFEEIKIIKNTYNNMLDNIDYLMKENEKKQREKNKEEMRSLERQLNPHFLSNTIGNIRFIAMVSKFESIQKMTEALMYILDSSFRNESSFHTLEEEIKILDSYVYLMKIRYANSFDIEYKIGEKIKNAIVPKLILQPFVENAITHGFSEEDIVGHICVCIDLQGKDINIEIIDNGKGMSIETISNIMKHKEDDGKQIGINNIAKRIKLYYGSEYNIEIISKPKISTSIKFKIPYQI